MDKAAQARMLQFQLGEVETNCGEQNGWEEPWQQVMYSGVLICPFTFLPNNTKIHAFCVFRQWTNKNSTLDFISSNKPVLK